MIPLSRTCDSRRRKKTAGPKAGGSAFFVWNAIGYGYQREPLVEPAVPESPLVPIGRLVLEEEPEVPPMPEPVLPEPVVPVVLPEPMPDVLPVAPDPEVPLPPVMPAPEPVLPDPEELGKLLDPAEPVEPEAPVVSEDPDAPDVPDAPEPDMPEVPALPVPPDMPEAPEVPDAPEPDMPDAPELPEVPDVPEAPELMSELPDAPLPVAPEVLAPVPSEPEAPVELLSMLDPELPVAPVLPVDEPELCARLAPATPIIEINTAKVSFFIMPPEILVMGRFQPRFMPEQNNGLSIRLPARNKRIVWLLAHSRLFVNLRLLQSSKRFGPQILTIRAAPHLRLKMPWHAAMTTNNIECLVMAQFVLLSLCLMRIKPTLRIHCLWAATTWRLSCVEEAARNPKAAAGGSYCGASKAI
jgi:hypothetical protein